MAIERNWTGFEGGDSGRLQGQPFRGSIFGDGTARTGEFHSKHISKSSFANTGQAFRRANAALGTGLALGEQAKVAWRCFIRLDNHVGTAGCRGGGIGDSSQSQKGQVVFDTSGHFAAAANDVIGSYSSFALSLGVWYRFDITYVNTQGAGANCTVQVTISAYTDSGVFIETVTQTQAVAAVTALPLDFAIGNASTSGSSTFDYSFDDWFWCAADKTDVSSVSFPTATKISRVSALAQGSSAAWAGDFRTIIDVPLETLFTDEQSTSTNGATTTFTHDIASNLGIGTVAGIVVRSALKTTGALGNDALMLNGVEYTVATLAAYGVEQDGVDFSNYTLAQFNAFEFGARNKRGVALQLGKCYCEVLHDGAGLQAPFINGKGPFRLKIVTWTGNGSYQTISGVGFGSQAIIVKPINDATAFGCWKISRMGGTMTRRAGGGVEASGILEITSDGFKIGPSTSINEAGTTYIAICIQDGGVGGYFLDVGSYIADSIDNRDIVLNHPFQPDLVFVFGPNLDTARTKDMVGDFSIGLGNSNIYTNKIQALNLNGFQIGTDGSVNAGGAGGLGTVYHYIALRSYSSIAFATGKVTPTGTTFTITGMTFSPAFVDAKKTGGTVVNSFFRNTLVHSGANSTPWPGGVNDVNGITSITADGFTGGSQVSANGVDTYWFALSPFGIDITGVYKLVPGKLNDTLYDRTVSPIATNDVDIPNPFFKTGLLGE